MRSTDNYGYTPYHLLLEAPDDPYVLPTNTQTSFDIVEEFVESGRGEGRRGLTNRE